MKRQDLTEYLNGFLKISEFKDYCPNGLQVEGREEINKVITAVSASLELFERAVHERADAIIVHHGVIWDSERPLYRGSYRKRLRLLLTENINLFAYHLPLDAHSEIGNNVQLGQALNLKNLQPFADRHGDYIGIRGTVEDIPKDSFFVKIENLVNRPLIVFPYGADYINQVGIISGAAQKDVVRAVAEGLDVFVTGEVSEHIMHYAREEKIHFVAAGHYATEKFGIMALSDHLSRKFPLQVKFIDIPNPV
jgi:dinuclear metal center YbgI/SA1388 family protein